MSKAIVVNVDYIKTSLIVPLTKSIDKLNATYKLLSNSKIPNNFQLKDDILKQREKMYLTIKSLNNLKTRLNTIIKKCNTENDIAIDEILNINHFLLKIKK